jgi:hypothetical protein
MSDFPILQNNEDDTNGSMVELTEAEFDAVAGGNPFSFSTNSGSFAIGAVFGDFSSAPFGSFAGQVNTFGTNNA